MDGPRARCHRGVREEPRQRCDGGAARSEEHTSELQSPCNLVCRLLLEKKHGRKFEHPRCQVGRKRHPVRTSSNYSLTTGRRPQLPARLAPNRTFRRVVFFLNDSGTTELSAFPSPAALRP